MGELTEKMLGTVVVEAHLVQALQLIAVWEGDTKSHIIKPFLAQSP